MEGIKKGLTYLGFFMSLKCCFSIELIPPIPEPMITPILSQKFKDKIKEGRGRKSYENFWILSTDADLGVRHFLVYEYKNGNCRAGPLPHDIENDPDCPSLPQRGLIYPFENKEG